jgi:DnaJ like chaperone protein
MSYSFLFRKAGRVLRSYLDSMASGETNDAEKKKTEYEEYFKSRTQYSDRKEQSQRESNRRESSENEREKKSTNIKDDKYFYNVFGLNTRASAQEVKIAYKKLIMQYHPDKVVNLGPELQSLAKTKTQEINEAYQYLKKKLNF